MDWARQHSRLPDKHASPLPSTLLDESPQAMVVEFGCSNHKCPHSIRNHCFGDCPVANVRIRRAASCVLSEGQVAAAPFAAPRPAQ
eukprot:11287656-Alexandrium_andersonii.AAC.1